MTELEGTGVGVSQLVLGPVYSRARSRGRPEWITADEVGAFCAALAGGQRAPGLYRLMTKADL